MSRALLTDLYELTMMQGYHYHGTNPPVVFDMFYRRQPFGGGFTLFAGLEPFLDVLEELRFEPADLEYLRSTGIFRDDFLAFLETYRFSGDLYAMAEGSAAFPNEPLIRVHAPLLEAQLIESLLLNSINFQTLIATKTARISLAAEGGVLLEFGLRRAHGPDGALSASRSAYIGGAAATSNTLAGKRLGIPVRGTMAHSWVMAFPSEEEAFRRYAEVFPDSCILLIDTYDTLGSGIENAVKVASELRAAGHRGFGVRLDSGDLGSLSKQVRARLDQAGLEEARIAVSNDLDETSIAALVAAGAPIDAWGVGTNLVTAAGDSALSGVYKLVAKCVEGRYEPVLKRSEEVAKMSNPGIKQVHRLFDAEGRPIGDLLALEDEGFTGGLPRVYDPLDEDRPVPLDRVARSEPQLQPVMKNGRRVRGAERLLDIRARALAELGSLAAGYTRLRDPKRYPVLTSEGLRTVRDGLLSRPVG